MSRMKKNAPHDAILRLAKRLYDRIEPILGVKRAQDVSNNVAGGYMMSGEDDEEDVPLLVAVHTALMNRKRHAKAYKFEDVTDEMIDQVLTAVEGMDLELAPKRTSRPPRRNPSKQKGFPWPRSVRLYHATVSMDQVLKQGLKPRKDLERSVHATGGGPEESVSFTTDLRVAVAIALGLRTLAHAARGEVQLGQMIIDMQQVAPKGVAHQLGEMKLSPEDVVRIDKGLIPFSAGMGSWRHHVRMEVLESTNRSELHDVTELKHTGAKRPYAMSGWTTPRELKRLQEASVEVGATFDVDKDTEWFAAWRRFEFYKYMLSYAEWDKELYNPFFIHTDPRTMAAIDDSQIGVVSATVDADWLCAEGQYAQAMGFDTSQMSMVSLSDWAHGCENRLRRGWDVQTKPVREWAQPEPGDTVTYAGAMSEVRVYDASLIRSLREHLDTDAVLDEARYAWQQRGHEIEEPLAYPYFQVRHEHLAR